MKTALIISSFVSASRVGATVNAFFLRQMGIETVILPTTLFGRHPGWGTPGGTVTSPQYLRDMWTAIADQNIQFDAILTGYLGHPDHVTLATDIIKTIKQTHPQTSIIVDPVMGDHGRLYIDPDIATVIQTDLIPLADLITPNLWEWCFISGYDRTHTTDKLEIIDHNRQRFSCDCLITSVPVKNSKTPSIGTLYIEGEHNYWVTHPEFTYAPNGSGDALVGAFMGQKLQGRTIKTSLAHATARVFAGLAFADTYARQEFPLAEAHRFIMGATPLDVETFSRPASPPT